MNIHGEILSRIEARCPHAIDRIHGYLSDRQLNFDDLWQVQPGGWYIRTDRCALGRGIVCAVLMDSGLRITDIARLLDIHHSTVRNAILLWARNDRPRQRVYPPRSSRRSEAA